MESIDEADDSTPSTDPAGDPDPTSNGASANTGVHGALQAVLEARTARSSCRRAAFRRHEFGLYLHLGYPSFEMYCDRELGKGRRTALERVRVAYAPDGLPRLRVMFEADDLSRELVRAITRDRSRHRCAPW